MQQSRRLRIDNKVIEIEKKNIKNMYLRILPPDGCIHISAPIQVSDEDIKQFVKSKSDWIEKQQNKMQNSHPVTELEYITGEEVYVWGEKYHLVVIESNNRKGVKAEGDNIILYTKENSSSIQKAKIMNDWNRGILQQQIPYLIYKWEAVIGVKSSSWNIRDMKTRWGTCNIRSKNITLNLQLVKKPIKCLEYVVVHELVHLLEKSHNQVFKAYMNQFLPQWRSIKSELNSNGE